MSEKIKAQMKACFPEGLEAIMITKDDYDRLCGDLTYENNELKLVLDKVREENQQLKEELKDENNYHNEAVKWYKEAFDTEQERIKYKSVLDEIREKIDFYIHYSTSDSAYMSYQQYKELLQILDKVKEGENNE